MGAEGHFYGLPTIPPGEVPWPVAGASLGANPCDRPSQIGTVSLDCSNSDDRTTGQLSDWLVGGSRRSNTSELPSMEE